MTDLCKDLDELIEINLLYALQELVTLEAKDAKTSRALDHLTEALSLLREAMKLRQSGH